LFVIVLGMLSFFFQFEINVDAHYFLTFLRLLFQLTTAHAAEMKRLYGLDYDAVPRIPKFPFRGDPQPATATVSDAHTDVTKEASVAPELRASSCETVDETPYVTYSHTIALKGIDILSSGRYRVQLNTFLKAPKKFSRNSTYLYEVSKMIDQDVHLLVISDVIYDYLDAKR
jgi:hypothetical protein